MRFVLVGIISRLVHIEFFFDVSAATTFTVDEDNAETQKAKVTWVYTKHVAWTIEKPLASPLLFGTS